MMRSDSSLIGRSAPRFHVWRERIDERLAGLASRLAAPAPLLPPLQEAITSAGKRVRAILLIAAAEAAGGRGEKVLDAATAIEMIHTSSLILDDLPAMDDALMRRGAPALHRRHGEDLAILSAVALLNHAYGLVAENQRALAPRRWPLSEVLQRLVDAVGWDGSIGGEAVDLHGEGSHLDFDTLEYIHSRKTGALFVASAAIGAMLANVHPAPLQRIETYAKNLGLAFQITDDILDVTATAEALGKDVGKDAERLTFVKLAGVEGARELAGELVQTSIDAVATLGAPAQSLRELAVAVGERIEN